MSSPFLAEIRMWACAFSPNGWAFCNGQIMPITQNTPLFSLLGVNFGGDGRTTFGLPNLKAAAPMHWGNSSQSRNSYSIGQIGGEPTIQLTQLQVPSHTHTLQGDPRPADLNTPTAQTSLARSTPGSTYTPPAGAVGPQPMSAGAVPPSGSGLDHNNMMPFQTLNFCIALQGVYPSRP